MTGALLSTVTVFFNVFPALIDWSSRPLPCSPDPEFDRLNPGGGGGGGAGIFLQSIPAITAQKVTPKTKTVFGCGRGKIMSHNESGLLFTSHFLLVRCASEKKFF